METNNDFEINLDELSVFDVSLLAFTSPQEINEVSKNSAILTSKDIYIWAGVLAYVISENEELEIRQIIRNIRRAVLSNIIEIQNLSFSVKNKIRLQDLDIRIVQSFLKESNFSSDLLQEIVNTADESRERLEKLGLIHDPFTKKIMGIMVGVMSLLPVSFTSKTEKGVVTEQRINAMLWQISRENNGQNSSLKAKIKVKEIADVMINEMIPDVLGWIDKILAGEMSEADVKKEIAEKELKSHKKELEYLISQGVNDPDVDLLFSILNGDVVGLKASINKGGNINVKLSEIRVKHRGLLANYPKQS